MVRVPHIQSRRRAWAVPLAGLLILAGSVAWALEPKDSSSYLGQKEFFKPELYISSSHEDVDEALETLPNRVAWENFQAARERAGKGRVKAFVDPRSGAATNILGAFPLIPGRGVGNQVTQGGLSLRIGRQVTRVDRKEVADEIGRAHV